MRAFLMGFVVALVACSDGSGLAGVGDKLATERAAWNARALVSYDFDLRYGGAWFPPTTIRIEVRDGIATSARDLATDAALPLGVGRHSWTVDSLFETAEHFAAQSGFDVALQFHPTLRYPTSLYIDNPGWADEEQSFEIVRLVAR